MQAQANAPQTGQPNGTPTQAHLVQRVLHRVQGPNVVERHVDLLGRDDLRGEGGAGAG